jgi:hypothetical protein
MDKLAQIGIVTAISGLIVALTGLFPGFLGLESAGGVGVLQILVILLGYSVLLSGAYLYVQAAYYPGQKHNLAQQIAMRLSMTGIVVAAASGLADVLGFGSHLAAPAQRPFTGGLQGLGVLGGFLIAAFGVVIFAVMGTHQPPDESQS